MLTDAYGREIKPGAKVAFNKSGYIRLGTVVEISMGHQYGRPRPIIKVLDQVDAGFTNPDLSRVRDTTNLVVLE